MQLAYLTSYNGSSCTVEGNPGKVKKEEQSVTVGNGLERLREDRGKPERVRDRSTEKVKRCRENGRGLCVSPGSGPYVACFNTPLHHLSHPTLQAKDRNGTSLISQKYTPTAISAL